MVTRPRIGELLLARGSCTREQLREAWEQKVIYGDRLGTNLLALGHIDEHSLARALGQQHGVHSGYGRVIAPEPAAVRRVPKSVAVRRFVVPHHVVGKQLFLMMRDPNDATAIDEVAFATDLKVTPVVVCEARIWQLLEVHYQTVLSMRPVPLDGALPVQMGSAIVGAAIDDVSATNIALGPELTSEEEFHRLYAGIHNSPSRDDIELPRITSTESSGEGSYDLETTIPGRPTAILADRDPDGHQSFLAPPKSELEWRDGIERTQPMMARPRLQSSDVGVPEPVIDLVEAVEMEPPLVRQSTADFHVEVNELVDESPLSFVDATRMLQAATDRNAIARIVLRAARTRFARACLLTVYPDRFLGWMGLGDGMQSDRLRDVVIARKEKSVFGLVADSRSHYLGPLARLVAHGAWVKATGRKIPKSIAVFPILVRRRPVNLLVVDNGHDQHVGSDVGEVLILAQQIAKTYETLLTTP